MKPCIAFDLDGTLFDHTGRGPNYQDPNQLRLSTRPIRERCQHVAELLVTHDVHFITGRGKVHAVHTMQALWHSIGPSIRFGQFHYQDYFTTYEAMRDFKAAKLNELQPVLFVGDHWADRDAAKLAGVPYQDEADYFPAIGLVTP